jgi:hypothetical protein
MPLQGHHAQSNGGGQQLFQMSGIRAHTPRIAVRHQLPSTRRTQLGHVDSVHAAILKPAIAGDFFNTIS